MSWRAQNASKGPARGARLAGHVFPRRSCLQNTDKWPWKELTPLPLLAATLLLPLLLLLLLLLLRLQLILLNEQKNNRQEAELANKVEEK